MPKNQEKVKVFQIKVFKKMIDSNKKMIDSNDLLAIGAALVQTVRSEIEYSTNMVSKGQLFHGLQQGHIFKKLENSKNNSLPFLTDPDFLRRNRILPWLANSISFLTDRSYSINDKIKKSLDLGIGNCEGLSIACLLIAKGLEKIRIGKFYLSLMTTKNPTVYAAVEDPTRLTFVLAHCSEKILGKRGKRSGKFRPIEYADSFEHLATFDDLNNAVIIDPWIYKATRLKNYTQHLKHSKLYNVEDFYTGPIGLSRNFNLEGTGMHTQIKPLSPIKIIEDKYIKKFNLLYRSYIMEKLRLEGDFVARGRSFSKVRRSLKQKQQQKQQQLTDLRDFFTRLNSQSLNWYSILGSNRKGECISAAIYYLNTCINNDTYPENFKLKELFQSILRILPIVRSSNTAPENLSLNKIDMTKSAKRIFNPAITHRRYAFEEINGLNLNWIRDASNLNDRDKYKTLVKEISSFTPPYDWVVLVKNFYTDKVGYYDLVYNAIKSGS